MADKQRLCRTNEVIIKLVLCTKYWDPNSIFNHFFHNYVKGKSCAFAAIPCLVISLHFQETCNINHIN